MPPPERICRNCRHWHHWSFANGGYISANCGVLTKELREKYNHIRGHVTTAADATCPHFEAKE